MSFKITIKKKNQVNALSFSLIVSMTLDKGQKTRDHVSLLLQSPTAGKDTLFFFHFF